MEPVARGLVVVAVPGDKRARALDAAARHVGGPAITWVSWAEALAEPARVGARGRPGDWLRVDSPGADDATWHALARVGGSPGVVPPGEWRPGRAWAWGLSSTLDAIARGSAHLVPTHPHVHAMTDKLACHALLSAARVPVPETFEAPGTVAALRARVAAEGRAAVFVKPRWGSSGAGVLAWRRSGEREQLTTTASLQADGRLLNDKHLHTYTERVAIDRLLGAVVADGAVVQRWIPKASVAGGGPFDLRVLVVDGRVAQRVARVGRGPITNLHLDAARADPDAVLAPFGPGAVEQVHAACLAAAACFPGHHTLGVDVMVDPRGRPFVLECNAWGDYLPGLLVGGLDSYGVQLASLLEAA